MPNSVDSDSNLSSYLVSDHMITRPLSEWSEVVKAQPENFSDWVVDKLTHMKNFHFSAVVHEFLKFTIRKKGASREDTVILFVERMVDKDEVTVGWKWVQHPKLTGWWIKRLLRGDFGDSKKRALLSSASSTSQWKAIGYSASDYLCHLDFGDAGLPLLDFVDVLVDSSRAAPKYGVVASNCFWFAFTVYEKLREERSCEEHRGGYYTLRGKFAGLSIIPYNLVSSVLPYFSCYDSPNALFFSFPGTL